MNLFISKLPFHGVVFCAIVATLASTAIAGPEKWASKDKTVEVAQEEPFNWTGLYIGGHIGAIWNDYDFGSFDSEADVFQQFFGFPRVPTGAQDIVFFSTPGIEGGSDDSIMGGGQAGYNFQFGHFVFGVEADFSGFSTDRVTTFTSDDETFFFFDGLSSSTDFTSWRQAETDWSASVRARFGYAGGPGRRVLLYVTGGVAFADVKVLDADKVRTTYFVLGPLAAAAPQIPPGAVIDSVVSNTYLAHDDAIQVGWTAGGGAEWAVNDTWSVGMEYRHNDFGDETYHFGTPRGPVFSGRTNVDLNGDQVTLRVNVLLGHIMARQ
jgi:outer membrane immunogenic protein